MKHLRWIGILVGLALLGFLVHQVGWTLIRQSLGLLGWGYPVVFASALAWETVNAVGFKEAFRPSFLKTPFIRLFQIRVVGETFNALLPSGYIGGEPLKVKFLAADMPLHEASSSVLIAKVAQSVSLVFYIVLGLTVTRPDLASPLRQRSLFLGIGGMAVGVGVFAWLIARGSFSQGARWLHRWTRYPALKRHEERFLLLDDSLRLFFRDEKKQFLTSFLWHSLGWWVSAMEIPLIGYLLGTPISWQSGWFMAALAQMGASLAVAVPEGIGFFEGGHYLAATLLGLPPSLGLTIGLIRRVRELFWHGIGLVLFWHLSKELARQNPAVRNSLESSPSEFL